jgi:hypothetical protein
MFRGFIAGKSNYLTVSKYNFANRANGHFGIINRIFQTTASMIAQPDKENYLQSDNNQSDRTC